MKRRLVPFLAILFALPAATPTHPPSVPIALLLQAGRNARVMAPDQESSGPPAEPGALLFYGSRVFTGGEPLSFVYYPGNAIYSFTPRYTALPLRNLDPARRNTGYEVRFDLKGVVRQNMEPEIGKELPAPLLLPQPQAIGAPPLPQAEAKQLLARIDAALNTASKPLDQALLRLSRAAVLEKANQLAGARLEYQRLAAVWNQAAWIRDQKIPAIDRQIRSDEAKALLARNNGRTLALLVGISQYKYTTSPLPASQIAEAQFAERDVAYLRAHLRSDATVALTGSQATVFNIRNHLRKLLETQAGPRDTVLIFLSGQGWTDMIGGLPKGFLMAYDSNPQDKTATAYPLEEMSETIRNDVARVKSVYLLADVCRTPMVASTPNTVNSILKAQFESIPGEAEIVLSSNTDTKPVQVSRVDAGLEGGHSIFSYYLVKGLAGAADYDRNNKVTPDELYRYVSEQVAAATGNSQQPVRVGRIAPNTPLATLVASAPPPRPPQNRVLLAFAGKLTPALLAVSAAAPRPQSQDRQLPAPPADPTALENEGQQIILQYLDGEETPLTAADYERGADRFRRAYAQDSSPEVLARLLFFEGRVKVARDDPAAIADLQNALQLDPSGAYAYNALGIAFLQRAAFADAAGAFRDAIGRAPHWVYPRHNLALTYAEAGVYDAAEREYREAIRIEPRYSYVHYNLAAMLQKLGRKSEAGREYREAIRLNRNHPEPYIGLGALLASEGKLTKAKENYTKAIDLNPKVPAAAHDLGLLYAKELRIEKAIDTWNDNVEKNPTFVPSRMSLAQAYAKQHKFDKAIEQYTKVLEISKDYAAAKMALHEAQGDLYRPQDTVRAREEYRQALSFAAGPQDKKRLNRKLRD